MSAEEVNSLNVGALSDLDDTFYTLDIISYDEYWEGEFLHSLVEYWEDQ